MLGAGRPVYVLCCIMRGMCDAGSVLYHMVLCMHNAGYVVLRMCCAMYIQCYVYIGLCICNAVYM